MYNIAWPDTCQIELLQIFTENIEIQSLKESKKYILLFWDKIRYD